MPEFEGGNYGAAEREWGAELSGEKEKKQQEATTIALLKEIKEDFNADPWQIPMEDYQPYLEAAQTYLDIADTDPDFSINENLAILAQDIINKAPMETAGE